MRFLNSFCENGDLLKCVHERIGLGVAEAFLSYGAHVHIIGFNQSSVTDAVNLLSNEYPDALSITGSTSDVRNESQIVEDLLKLAPVDHIVYTAVDARIRGPIADEDIEKSQELFGVKFWVRSPSQKVR